jgi:hypothetical protein
MLSNIEQPFDYAGLRLIARARAFATGAHAAVGQKRKYTEEPYIVHPAGVAKLVAAVPGISPEAVAAAWLHDVVEDTGVIHDDIVMWFGPRVATLVWWLTHWDIPKTNGGRMKRSHRKALDLMNLMTADWEGQTIKVADFMDNGLGDFDGEGGIVARDPDFAPMYLREMETALDALDLADPVLRRDAYAMIGHSRSKLRSRSAHGIF